MDFESGGEEEDTGQGEQHEGPSCVERQRFTTVLEFGFGRRLLLLPPPLLLRRKGSMKAASASASSSAALVAFTAAFAVLLIPAMNLYLTLRIKRGIYIVICLFCDS